MQNLASRAWQVFSGISRRITLACFGLALIAGLLLLPGREAQACAPCGCVSSNHSITRLHIAIEHFLTQLHIAAEFEVHREEFWVYYFFKEHILAALMMMTEQLVSAAMNQMFIVGTFIDAQQQIETQQLFQRLAAEAHKNYHPSMEMCEIGTLSRSLAASQRQGEFNAFLLSQHMQDRQMRTGGMGSGAGKGFDVVNRWNDFKRNYCNPNDNNAYLGPRADGVICDGAPLHRRNQDVDYTRMVDNPLTIEANYATPALEPDQAGIMALANNLYGNDVLPYMPEAFFKNPENHDEFVYVRSIVAKRSVAMNSFANIVALKTEGKAESALVQPYMAMLLEQLGVENPVEQMNYLRARPSYYAQMEMLTKRLYQRPEFYTSLYDKPVNVERKRAAMRAIALMQNMDLYKSKLRTEAALAVLTEMEVFKEQKELQNRMSGTRDTGLQ